VNSPPSGPWSGYYLYGYAGPKHRMRLVLTFNVDGKIKGNGVDDIGPFAVDGVFDLRTNEVRWTKSYVGAHSVKYGGFYDQKTICGSWNLMALHGGFWIWPGSAERGEDAYGETEQLAEAQLLIRGPKFAA